MRRYKRNCLLTFARFCLFLLTRHNLAHLGFAIFDQLAADLHRYGVDRAGEFEGRFVLWGNRGTTVHTAFQRPTRHTKDQWRGIGEISLTNQLSIKVELGTTGYTFASVDIRLTRDLELKAQLVFTGWNFFEAGGG